MSEFSYGFDELEIAPGLMAWGYADFQKRANDSFEMIGLSLYFHKSMDAVRLTDPSEWVWQLIERTLIQLDDNKGILSDAHDAANADEFDPDYWRDEKIERMRIDLL